MFKQATWKMDFALHTVTVVWVRVSCESFRSFSPRREGSIAPVTEKWVPDTDAYPDASFASFLSLTDLTMLLVQASLPYYGQ